MNLLRKCEGFASKGMNVVDLRGCCQVTEDVRALGGVRVRMLLRD